MTDTEIVTPRGQRERQRSEEEVSRVRRLTSGEQAALSYPFCVFSHLLAVLPARLEGNL